VHDTQPFSSEHPMPCACACSCACACAVPVPVPVPLLMPVPASRACARAFAFVVRGHLRRATKCCSPRELRPIRTPARKLLATPTPMAGATPLYALPEEDRQQSFDVPKELPGLPNIKPEDMQYFGALLQVRLRLAFLARPSVRHCCALLASWAVRLLRALGCVEGGTLWGSPHLLCAGLSPACDSGVWKGGHFGGPPTCCVQAWDEEERRGGGCLFYPIGYPNHKHVLVWVWLWLWVWMWVWL